jgi:hypothetical protein
LGRLGKTVVSLMDRFLSLTHVTREGPGAATIQKQFLKRSFFAAHRIVLPITNGKRATVPSLLIRFPLPN